MALGARRTVDADEISRLLIAEILYEHEVDFAVTADDAVRPAHAGLQARLLKPLSAASIREAATRLISSPVARRA